MSPYRQFLQNHLLYLNHDMDESSTGTGHLAFDQWIIGCLRPRFFVQLGVGNGDSYCAFAQAVKDLQSSTRCYGIDDWSEDSGATYHNPVLKKLRSYHDPRYSGFSQLIVSSPDETLTDLPDQSVDLLYIDGIKGDDTMRRRFETWFPKLSKRAVVLIHGINMYTDRLGEREAPALQDVSWQIDSGKQISWDELRGKRRHFSFYHGYGLGVLAVGSNLPESIEPLFNASEEHTILTRSYFSALTRALVEKGDFRRLAEQSETESRIREINRFEFQKYSRDRLEYFTRHLDEFTFYRALVRFPGNLSRRIYKNAPKWLRRVIERRQILRDLLYLRSHEGFDIFWYRNTYADASRVHADPLRHYLEQGERKGFQPNSFFSIEKDVVRNYQKGLFFGSYYVGALKERQRLVELWSKTRRDFSPNPAILVPFGSAVAYTLPDSIAVICHCYYLDVLEELLSYLGNLKSFYFLYISTDTEQKKAQIVKALKARGRDNFEVRICENRGRDVAPKLITFKDAYVKHTYFIHLHTKKSLHTPGLGNRWRHYLYVSLLGSPEVIRSIFQIMEQPEVGIVYPCHIDEFQQSRSWGLNFIKAKALLARMDISVREHAPFSFPAGSMFWGRSAALMPLLNLNLTFADFNDDGPVDGTLPHAIERIICLVAEKAGFSTQQIVPKGHFEDGESIFCGDAADLPRALQRSRAVGRRVGFHDFLKSFKKRK